MSTLLLLDDDPEFHQLVTPALEQRGHRVLQAHRAAEASSLLARETVDMAVVDGLLPDADGISWIAKMRAQGIEVPVVFVSSFWRDLSSFNRLTKDLRVCLVVHKPVLPQLFAAEVEERLASPTRVEPPPRPLAAQGPEEAFRTLQAEYARSLPHKLRELAGAVNLVRQEPANAQALDLARQVAHRLRGTAGSYGFEGAGAAAGVVEDVLIRARRNEAIADDWVKVEQQLAATFQAAEQAAQVAPAPAAYLASGRILLVSRDPLIRSMAEEVSRQQLYELISVSGAEEALRGVGPKPPDAVFIDLPGPRAQELCRELRAMPKCETVPLAFVGEKGTAHDRIAAAHAGASVYLDRPLSAEAFAAAARRLVSMQQAQQPRILIVDDDEHFAQRAAALLRQSSMLVTALGEPARILEVLEEAPPDLLLLDVMLPGLSGLDVCRMLRATPRWQDLPVIVVTAQTGLEARVAAFQAGADDYLGKPVVDEELLARVRVRVERARLLREKYDRDPLTGLLLRRPFVEALRGRILEAQRHSWPLALAMIDLDRFKDVNDRHGHLAGDGVLSALGKLLTHRFRAEDLRGRWGGEEFLLAFPGERSDTVEGALGRLLEEFRALAFKGDAGESFSVTFCAGVSAYPEDGDSLESLLKAADRRLYAAKGSGRDRVLARG
jgi:diguanylate cyclase (GGDEF)-like protein